MKNIKPAPLNRSIILKPKEKRELKSSLVTIKENVSVIDIENKIIHGDLNKISNYLPANFVDLMFIDPPYNLYKKFNNNTFKEMSEDEYTDWIDSWLSGLVKLLKPAASIYICADWKSSSAVYKAGCKYFRVRNRITWEREKGRGAKYNWKNCSEDIWFFTNSDNYTFNIDKVKIKRKVIAPYKDINGKPKDWNIEGHNNFRITYPSNIWNDITIPFWSMPENTNHPTQKPEKLLAKIILASSSEKDFVFDPFLGSGTTAVAAKKLNRRYAGIEIDEEFCLYSEKRLKLADQDRSIQGYEDGVFWERNTFKIKYNGKIKNKS